MPMSFTKVETVCGTFQLAIELRVGCLIKPQIINGLAVMVYSGAKFVIGPGGSMKILLVPFD